MDRKRRHGHRQAPVTRPAPRAVGLAALAAVAAVAGGCASGPRHAAGVIVAIGAENQYANVITQIGGKYVAASAIMSNPNVDPHTFEVSPKIAQAVSGAQLVVQNGLGYDAFMNRLEAAAPNPRRKVITVQHLLDLPNSTANPHLWYRPSTMPAVARAIAHDLASLLPAHRAFFSANLARFDASLEPWRRALANVRARFAHAPVAVTEPVADDLLQAAGVDVRTPWAFQADLMNGVDPSAQDVTLLRDLLTQRRVRAFLYNVQVTDTLTESLAATARAEHIPLVAVYETMPTPGYTYQSWMLAETKALQRALARGISTTRL